MILPSSNKSSQNQVINLLTRKVAKGSGINLAGSAFGILTQFGLHILLGRVLGAGGYGLYALGYSIFQLISKISLLGLENGVVRFISIYRGEQDLRKVKGVLVSAFSIATIISILSGVFLFTFSEFVAISIFKDSQLIPIFKAFSISLPFLAFMQIAAHTARGFQKMQYYIGIQNIIRPITNALFVGIMFIIGFRIIGAVYGFLTSVIITSVIGIFFILKRIFPQAITAKPNYEVRKLLWFSLPVVFIGFAQIILNQTDKVMLGYFMTSSDVGIYNAAARIAIQTNFIITAFNNAFAPIISDLYNRQEITELAYLFKLITRWIVILTLPFTLIMVLFPKFLLGLFGSEFLPGAIILIILSIAYFLNAATGSVGLILIMSGKQDIELVNILTMTVINIGLNIWLIPLYGIMGAAFATGLSMTIININRIISVFKLVGIQPYTKSFYKPLLAGGITFIIFQLLTNYLDCNVESALCLLGLLLIYIVVMLILGLDKEDKSIVLAICHKFASMIRR